MAGEPSSTARWRVALVCPYSLSRPGGVQGQVAGLARSLERRGHEVTVLAPLDSPGDRPEGLAVVATGRSVALPANGSVAPVTVSPRAVARAVESVRSGGYDVVHVHEPFTPGVPYGLLAAHRLPPLVATFHRSGSSPFYTALRPLVRRLAGRLAVRCAVSDAARTTAEAALGGEYRVGFNGVEVDRFEGAEPWPSSRPAVLFLGRHEPRKGLGVLLDAFARLLRVGPVAGGGARPVLWVAGDGPETDALRRRHPGSDDIEWLGVVSEADKARRLAGAKVLAAPSLAGESFGMVLLEGMAAGATVVASDIDGYRDAAGGHAALVAPGDPAALAAALAVALPEQDLDALARASAWAGHWSMDRLAAWYEEVYASAAGADGAAHGRGQGLAGRTLH